MALYIDSAYFADIVHVAQTVPVAGVTTNPTLMLQAQARGQGMEPQSLLIELLRNLDGTIFIQPGASTEKEMLEQALAYIQAAPERVIPKIPMLQAGMRVARQLKQHDHRVAFTAVTSLAQAYCAAMLGADFVIPYYNRLERAGVDASERIAEMAELFHNQHIPTRILAASIKSSFDAMSALCAGAHDITAAPQVLLDMVSDPQTDEAIKRFTLDWQKLNRQ
jgi:TalC/MipB family fructose-6-phosphate aldolase